MTEPSNAELVRRVDELVVAQRELLTRIDQLLRDVAQAYATKERVDGLEKVHDQRIRELEKDNESRAGFNRQIIAALIIGFVLLLIPLIGQIQNVVGGAQ